MRDGRIAELTVHVVPFAILARPARVPATAAALDRLVASVATDCFLTAQAIGHVRPGLAGDGETLAAHRLARARSEAVQAALVRGGLPAELGRQRLGLPVHACASRASPCGSFSCLPGEECTGAPLPGADARARSPRPKLPVADRAGNRSSTGPRARAGARDPSASSRRQRVTRRFRRSSDPDPRRRGGHGRSRRPPPASGDRRCHVRRRSGPTCRPALGGVAGVRRNAAATRSSRRRRRSQAAPVGSGRDRVRGEQQLLPARCRGRVAAAGGGAAGRPAATSSSSRRRSTTRRAARTMPAEGASPTTSGWRTGGRAGWPSGCEQHAEIRRAGRVRRTICVDHRPARDRVVDPGRGRVALTRRAALRADPAGRRSPASPARPSA